MVDHNDDLTKWQQCLVVSDLLLSKLNPWLDGFDAILNNFYSINKIKLTKKESMDVNKKNTRCWKYNVFKFIQQAP